MIENQKIRPAQVIGPLGEPLTLASLPPPETTRWVVRRKAEVVAAVNGGLLTDIFGVNAFPTVCVIDVDNTMLNNQLWPTSLEDLVAAIPDNGTTVPMSCTVGIGPVRSDTDVRITPSITSGRTAVLVDLQRSVELRTEITDQLGRSVLQVAHGRAPAGRSTHALDLGELGQGNYFVRVFADGQSVASSRVIVAR